MLAIVRLPSFIRQCTSTVYVAYGHCELEPLLAMVCVYNKQDVDSSSTSDIDVVPMRHHTVTLYV